MQKLMYKGKMRDEATLRELDVKKNAKIMLIGSTVTDVLSVSAPDMKALKEEEKKEKASSKEPLSKQKVWSVPYLCNSINRSFCQLLWKGVYL